jgi:hypothetical protein
VKHAGHQAGEFIAELAIHISGVLRRVIRRLKASQLSTWAVFFMVNQPYISTHLPQCEQTYSVTSVQSDKVFNDPQWGQAAVVSPYAVQPWPRGARQRS